MPHILLRTSADLVENVDVPDILASLVETLASFETVGSADIKAYHELHPHWAMGEGAPCGFAHLQVSLLSGRDETLLKTIGDGLYARMKQLFATSIEAGEIKPTLEIRQMPKPLYWKS